MATIHAWFSSGTALRIGSAVYRKLSGNTVNVTRVSVEKDKGPQQADEKYVGEVIREEDGGRVSPISRLAGITR
jgi:hypothetical protein